MEKKLKLILFLLISFLIIFFYRNFQLKKTLKEIKKSPNNLNKYPIAIVFGTRTEAVKMIPIIKELKNNKKFFCVVINTNQHSKMTKQILKSLNISDSIDIELNIMKNNQTLSDLTHKTILELNKIFLSINPNAVIVQGDTTTSFSAALSAFYLKIPVFHVEAGLRTKNLYSPFPEEFNRMAIDDISTLLFAATETAAINLLNENKNPMNIFITGNTIVDSLYLTINKTSPSIYINNLLYKAKSLCKSKDKCKIILLTCHRRENYFIPIANILKAAQRLLEKFEDIVIILPFHLNPNVILSIKMGLPEVVYNEIINGKQIENKSYLFLNRLLIIQPLNYTDLVHLQSQSFFIMTDSGGIQEEGISIGKPVLILRNNTERPEGVNSGSAIITGTSIENIYYYASLLIQNITFYNQMAQPHNIYGFGNSSKIIVHIIECYFDNKLSDLPQFNKSLSKPKNFSHYELVIVLTVWKRNNLERQLMQVKRQSIIKNKKTNLIVFQNFNHIDINDTIEKWKQSDLFNDNVKLTVIKSPIETGYFGRFLIPLVSSIDNDSYFIICDDDIIWGDRYFENMIRVVDEGSLATRNGRIINQNYIELIPGQDLFFRKDIHVCFNKDIEYDFGGHIWAGRISWLRKAWTHIPVSIENCEDFWLSAVLKTFYNISTKTPKCPCEKDKLINPDLCAASDNSAGNHKPAIVGNSIVKGTIRDEVIRKTIIKFNYKLLISSNPNIVEDIRKEFICGNNFFNLSDPLWKDVLYWQ